MGSELMMKTIEGLPAVNTQTLPLIGTCPNCQGDEDEAGGPQHASGHARVCWDPQALIDTMNRRTDCSSGRKAILCTDALDLHWSQTSNSWSHMSYFNYSHGSNSYSNQLGVNSN